MSDQDHPVSHVRHLPDDVVQLLSALELALLDFDGVVADTEPLHEEAYRVWLNRNGFADYDLRFERFLGRPEPEIWQLIQRETDRDIQWKKAWSERLQIFGDLVVSKNLKPFPFIGLLLRELAARHVPAWIVSSQWPGTVKGMLELWGLMPHVRGVRTVYDDGPRRGKPEVIADLVATASSPRRVLLVEDSDTLIDFGRSLGLATLRVRNAYRSSPSRPLTLHRPPPEA